MTNVEGLPDGKFDDELSSPDNGSYLRLAFWRWTTPSCSTPVRQWVVSAT